MPDGGVGAGGTGSSVKCVCCRDALSMDMHIFLFSLTTLLGRRPIAPLCAPHRRPASTDMPTSTGIRVQRHPWSRKIDQRCSSGLAFRRILLPVWRRWRRNDLGKRRERPPSVHHIHRICHSHGTQTPCGTQIPTPEAVCARSNAISPWFLRRGDYGCSPCTSLASG